MRILVNAAAGCLFGIGLIISGMANPPKVLNFLDIAGTWDPSLAFVMAGAIAITATGYYLTGLRDAPLLEDKFELPPSQPITAELVAGSAIFGWGWGLSGFCPGPAIASVALGSPGTVAFVAAMLTGIIAGRLFLRRRFPVVHFMI